MNGSALLAAVASAPDDDVPRMVYADWLSQQGDPLGELIALQVQLARADADDVRLPERARIASRIRALLKAHGEAWTAPLRAIANATYTFRRGFIEHVADYADRNLGFVAEQLFAHAPLLRAAHVTPGQLHSVIMNEAAERFEELSLLEASLDRQMLARLHERLGGLRSVDFEAPFVVDRDAHDKLAEWPIPLEHFGIAAKANHGILVSATFLKRFAGSPHRDRLRSLRFEKLHLERLEPLPTLFGVERLLVAGCRLGRQHGRLVNLVAALPSLTSLAVETDEISGDELAEVVALCPNLRRLRFRAVRLESLASLPQWTELRRLDLTGRGLDDEIVKPLLAAEWPHLMELRLSLHELSAPMQRALADRFAHCADFALKRVR